MSNLLEQAYARFEDRFRGSREDIVKRLEAYEPLLTLISAGHESPEAIDCGCGRGEWLEVLSQRGWNARGIDTNRSMLAAAQQRGLNVERGEATAYLSALPAASVPLVSAFHLVEHLPTEGLLTFLYQALRVLSPDGVLVLETPNPENLLVATCNFHLDPTHRQPIPPALLSFFAEDNGATTTRVVRLNGEPAGTAPEGTFEAAIRPMFTTGLDYAVIATKSTDPRVLEGIDAFIATASQAAPVDLSKVQSVDASMQRSQVVLAEQLAAGFQQQQTMQASLLEKLTGLADEVGHGRIDAMKQLLAEETARVAQLEAQLSVREREWNARLQAVHGEVHRHAQLLVEARNRETQLAQYTAALLASRSWKVTRPLRALTDLRQRIAGRKTPGGADAAARGPIPALKVAQPAAMIDPDPEALAAWSRLLSSPDRKKESDAAVD
jgi:SAM-dependent methyltransferase